MARIHGMLVLFHCLILLAAAPAHAQKTDVITLTNGNRVTGEMKVLDRGLLEFKTAAMSTVNVEWPKVVTATTDKHFEIVLEDGTIYFGSLTATASDSVIVVSQDGRTTVATHKVVRLQRLKPNFWAALDGHIEIGFGYTQQSNKTDFSTGGTIAYARHANLTKLTFDTSFSSQDDTEDIFRLDGSLAHLRQYKKRWFYLGFVSASRNSQMSLDYRVSVGGGIGRMVVESNRLDLGIWVGPAYSREEFTGELASNSWPLIFSADFLFFVWESLDTDLFSQLMVLPILGEGGRWRLNWNLQAEKELFKSFYIALDFTEQYDSNPPASDANKNDFSVTSSLKWKF